MMKVLQKKNMSLNLAVKSYSGDRSTTVMYLNDVGRIKKETTKADRVLSNLCFVISIAKKYASNGNIDDLIQEGNIGLIKAAEKHEERGYGFISYAEWWIREKILCAITQKQRTIRLPRYKEGYRLKINKVKEWLSAEMGRELTDKEIAAYLQVSSDDLEVELAKIKNTDVESLDGYAHKDDESALLVDNIADPRSDNIEEKIIDSILEDVIEEFLNNNLMLMEQDVIERRFGLNGREEETLEEIGNYYDLTKQGIQHIEEKALRKLRQSREKKKLEGFI